MKTRQKGKEKMRIAFFLSSFPLISETFILRQITGLIDLGHDVDIYAESRPPKDAPVHSEVLKYNLLDRTIFMIDHMPEASGYWEMPAWPISGETWLPGVEFSIPNRERVKHAAPHLIKCLLKTPELAFEVLDVDEYGIEARSLSALYRLSIFLSVAKKYDILHAHFGPMGNTFRFARSFFNAPLIVSFHGYDFCVVPRQQGLQIYNRLFSTADVFLANSEYTRNRLVELGCPLKKILNLSVGLNLDEFKFRERHIGNDDIYLLSIARLVEKKGLEYSIRAVAKVIKKYPKLKYVIVGDGPLMEKLKKLIGEMQANDHIQLVGVLPSNKIAEMMGEAHIFLLPSVTAENGDQEGQGLVLQEAQASGLPIIATNHGPFSEGLINGKSGFLVPERDVDSLVQRLCELIEQPDIREQMGKAGRAYVEKKYNIVMLNNQLVEIYERAIQQYKGPASLKPLLESTSYWIQRYNLGGDSGPGSYNRLSEFKAETLNRFVKDNKISKVIEFGCGDGNQLRLADYQSYIGFDVSPMAILRCEDIFRGDQSKHFRLISQYIGETADLTLSLDVIYHLIEDDIFSQYMERLFDSSERYVIVYASNSDKNVKNQAPHVKHRQFTNWVEKNRPAWRLIGHIPNKFPFSAGIEDCPAADISIYSFADFYIFEKT